MSLLGKRGGDLVDDQQLCQYRIGDDNSSFECDLGQVTLLRLLRPLNET
jgi:hypothetical protein